MIHKYKYPILYLIITGVIFITAILLEKGLCKFNNHENDIKRFQEVLFNKESRLDNLTEDIYLYIKEKGIQDLIEQNHKLYSDLNKDEGIYILVYDNDSLKFWSDNSVPVSNIFSNSFYIGRTRWTNAFIINCLLSFLYRTEGNTMETHL